MPLPNQPARSPDGQPSRMRSPVIVRVLVLARGRHHRFLSLAGDGCLDLVEFGGRLPGFYKCTAHGSWEPFALFRALPNVAREDLPFATIFRRNGPRSPAALKYYQGNATAELNGADTSDLVALNTTLNAPGQGSFIFTSVPGKLPKAPYSDVFLMIEYTLSR